MKRRSLKKYLKKRLNSILDSYLPPAYKILSMHRLIECARKHDVFLYNNLFLECKRFSTTIHKGIVSVSEWVDDASFSPLYKAMLWVCKQAKPDSISVSEHERVDEVSFSSLYNAMVWICKQAKTDTEYVVDSGNYRYRVCFSQ